MAASLIDSDPAASVAIGREGVELCRRYGYRSLHLGTLMNAAEAAIQTGDLAWVEAELATIADDDLEWIDRSAVLVARTEVGSITGREVEGPVRRLVEERAGAPDTLFDTAIAIGLTWAALAENDLDKAYGLALEAARPGQLNEPGGLALAARISILRRDRDALRVTIERLDELGARGPLTELVRDDARAGALALDGRWGEALAAYHDLWRRHRDGGLRFTHGLSQLGAVAAAPSWEPGVAAIAAEARAAFEESGALAFVGQVDALVASRSDTAKAPASAEHVEAASTVAR
jgi:hypothetical protein